jgi:hypothetical protein
MAKKKSLPVDNGTAISPSYRPSKADVEREKRYRAEDAVRTIRQYEEIRKDKDLMKDVKQHLKEQAKLANKL